MVVHQERISLDRGADMNQRRLRGDFVDVAFKVGEKKFNAHRFIVSLHSPYLRKLVDRSGEFSESANEEIELKCVNPEIFGDILAFIYTGKLVINEENVFDLVEAVQYLQVFEDKVVEKCLKLLIAKLRTCPLVAVFKIWNLAEQYGFSDLKAEVMFVLEFRLEEFLRKDFFMFLGYEEIRQILTHPALCVRSELALFNALISWIDKKVVIDEEDEDDLEDARLALGLLSELKLNVIDEKYVISKISSVLPLEKLSPNPRAEILSRSRKSFGEVSRKCSKCIYLFEYSRDEKEMLGIREFISERLHEPTYAYFNPEAKNSNCLSVIEGITHSKSYFRHYGPHSTTEFNLVTLGNSLLTVGGIKRGSLKTGDAGTLTDEVKILDLESGAWEHYGGILPYSLHDFAAVTVGEDHLFIIGGLSDEVGEGSIKSPRKVPALNRSLNVSRSVFSVRQGELTRLASWVKMADMPEHRTSFSAVALERKIYVIGNNFCDIYDVRLNLWNDSSTANPPIPSGSEEKPAIAVLGSKIFVFGNRNDSGENVFQVLETTSMTWSRIPGLNLRLNIIAAFPHNGLIYLISWQRSNSNMIHVYDTTSESWRAIVLNLGGRVRPGTLIRRQMIDEKNLFYGSKPLHCTETPTSPLPNKGGSRSRV